MFNYCEKLVEIFVGDRLSLRKKRGHPDCATLADASQMQDEVGLLLGMMHRVAIGGNVGSRDEYF